jgi:hypothetical protein
MEQNVSFGVYHGEKVVAAGLNLLVEREVEDNVQVLDFQL